MVIDSEQRKAIRFGPFRLVASERLLLRNQTPITLRSRAFDLLMVLLEQAGEIVSRQELMRRIWPDVTVEDANLRVLVAGLRRSLGDGREGVRYIANIPGRGYCFIAPVQHLSQETPLAVGPAAERTLPAALQRMIGRDETVKALRLEVASKRFVSIVGSGGIGKTTVAVAVGHAMANEFGNLICFIDFAALKDRNLVVPAVATSVGYLGQTTDSLSKLITFLADKRILLILDSCEHVIEAVAALAGSLFHDAPCVHILATTREALRTEGENVYHLRSLESPSGDIVPTSAQALACPAVQLFMDRAAAGGYLHDLNDKDAPVVASICRHLDGIPLAIELAASRASTYGIKGLAEAIGHRFTLSWPGRRAASRHHTLRATLDWSYDLLADHEKQALCGLSVFVGPFTLEAAQAIADDARDVSQVATTIAGLVDKSLMTVSPTEHPSQYRLLDTTRAYAATKLADRNEVDVIAKRHALYYSEHLAEIRIGLAHKRNVSVHARQVGDIRAALQWSLSPSGDTRCGVALGARAVLLFLHLSMFRECRHWCQSTLKALNDDERGTKLELILQASLAITSMFAQGDSDGVNAALERGIALAEATKDTDFRLQLLAGFNLFQMRRGDFGGALAAANRYAAAATEIGSPRELVVSEWMLGGSHHLVGDQAAAQHHYQQGFALATACGSGPYQYFGFDHEVWALIGLGKTLWLRGLPDQAEHFADQGIDMARRQDNPVTLCICLIYAVEVFLWRGNEQFAAELIEWLTAVAEKYSLAPYRACGLVRLGQLLVAQGNVRTGIEHLRHARSILTVENNYILFSTISRTMAEGLARDNQSKEAIDLIDASIVDAERGSGTFELPDLLRAKAKVLLIASPANRIAAELALIKSLDHARNQSALGWELRSAIDLARLWADHDRTDDARDLLSRVYGRFTEGFATIDLVEASNLLRILEQSR
jgi:predicted ATPase/DNA-binding winged helix-turn-helix (wHTH) protein